MSQTNGKKAKTSKLYNAEDFWTKLNAEMSDEDITRMHKQIVEDLGHNLNNIEPIGHEKWWLDD